MANYSSIFYKADQRACKVAETYKCFSTLNSGHLNLHRKDPVGMEYCHDVMLSPGSAIHYAPRENMFEIVLPVTGAVSYNDAATKFKPVASEEVLLADNRMPYSLQNPYKNGMINYLQIGLSAKGLFSEMAVCDVNLKEYNAQASLSLDDCCSGIHGSVGIYQGRVKGNYALKDPSHGVFVYVINGAFEVEDRLMEYRDGLSLWNTNAVGFESLSESGILLVIETPLNAGTH